MNLNLLLKIASLILAPAALAVKAFAGAGTIAYHVADYVLGALAGLGVYSSTAGAQQMVQGKVQGS